MSFENAPVSKGGVEARGISLVTFQTYRMSGLMLWLAMASVLAGIFDIKYYFHLQVRSMRLVRRPVGMFTFCTARATHFGPSPSAPFHWIGKASDRNADI